MLDDNADDDVTNYHTRAHKEICAFVPLIEKPSITIDQPSKATPPKILPIYVSISALSLWEVLQQVQGKPKNSFHYQAYLIATALSSIASVSISNKYECSFCQICVQLIARY